MNCHVIQSTLKEIKSAITELYNLISAINAKEKAEYQTGTMRKFIEQRCTNYKENKYAMLSSALSCTRRRITLDRIIINNGPSSELIIDPDTIAVHTTEHFRTVAGGRHQQMTLPHRWAKQYSQEPISMTMFTTTS